jgi:hypothetical protein
MWPKGVVRENLGDFQKACRYMNIFFLTLPNVLFNIDLSRVWYSILSYPGFDIQYWPIQGLIFNIDLSRVWYSILTYPEFDIQYWPIQGLIFNINLSRVWYLILTYPEFGIGQFSGKWKLLMHEYGRKSLIISGKKDDFQRLNGWLKLRLLDRNKAISLKPGQQCRSLYLVLSFKLEWVKSEW